MFANRTVSSPAINEMHELTVDQLETVPGRTFDHGDGCRNCHPERRVGRPDRRHRRDKGRQRRVTCASAPY